MVDFPIILCCGHRELVISILTAIAFREKLGKSSKCTRKRSPRFVSTFSLPRLASNALHDFSRLSLSTRAGKTCQQSASLKSKTVSLCLQGSFFISSVCDLLVSLPLRFFEDVFPRPLPLLPLQVAQPALLAPLLEVEVKVALPPRGQVRGRRSFAKTITQVRNLPYYPNPVTVSPIILQ